MAGSCGFKEPAFLRELAHLRELAAMNPFVAVNAFLERALGLPRYHAGVEHRVAPASETWLALPPRQPPAANCLGQVPLAWRVAVW